MGRNGINIFTACPSAYFLITMLSLDRIALSESCTLAGCTFTLLTFHVMLSELLIRTYLSLQKIPKLFAFEVLTHIAKQTIFQ